MNATVNRWQDWAAVVVGAVVALSPLWVDTNSAALWSMVVLGVLIAATGVAGMVSFTAERMGGAMTAVAMGVFGVLLFLAPWVTGYADMAGAAWTSWVAGVVTALTALAAMPEGSRMHIGHRGGLAPHH